MKLSCTQMDVLISFYIEEELSPALKKQVEDHLKNCAICRAKFDIVKNMIDDLKNCFEDEINNSDYHTKITTTSQQYRVFQDNLSAYLDNELNNEESIKLKKFTINNKTARKELQDSYNLRKLMNKSFEKIKFENKQDYSKNILKRLEIEDEIALSLHPIIKCLIIFLGFIFISAIVMLFFI